MTKNPQGENPIKHKSSNVDYFFDWLNDTPTDKTSNQDQTTPFTPTKTLLFKTTEKVKQESKYTIAKLSPIEQIQNWDLWIRIGLRIIFVLFFFGLLCYQNITAFNLVVNSLQDKNAKDLQLIFATLIGGTLIETYLIVKIMVQWVFSDNKYPKKNNGNLESINSK